VTAYNLAVSCGFFTLTGEPAYSLYTAGGGLGFGPSPPAPLQQAPIPTPVSTIRRGDYHVRRSGDDYVDQIADLYPRGVAWPRDEDSTLMKLVKGCAQIFGYIDGRAADLLERETDPRKTIEMLPDWERNFGLPDPCFNKDTSIGARQATLVLKMTMQGGQSRAFFKRVAQFEGTAITITEHAPYMAGISRCGDTTGQYFGDPNPRWELGPPEIRFFWSASATDATLVWARAGVACGGDYMLDIILPEDLDCLLQRWKPAHTKLVYDFSNLDTATPTTGLP
jgi:uncharacterized protein YmfQ (DUF2313 family)